MTTRTFSKLPIRPLRLKPGRPSLGRRALLLAATVALSITAVPAVAQASPVPSLAPSRCARVSAASVGAVVGHPVPAGTLSINNLKPTKADDGVSAVVTSCIYGSVTNLTGLSKVVVVGLEVTSRALTGTELMHSLSQAQVLKFVFKPYTGLGMKAFYYTFTEGPITIQGIAAINGTKIYSAGLYIKAPALHALGGLVRLAEKL